MEHPLPVRPTPQYRRGYHFTPAAQWMNDPNGLVFHQGQYHLFFQYHPHSTTWGPMHGGHASRRDLLHWDEHPVALHRQPVDGVLDLGDLLRQSAGRSALGLQLPGAQDLVLALGNAAGDGLTLGFDRQANAFFVDRRQAGQVDFSPAFACRQTAPRLAAAAAPLDLQVYLDSSSVELFGDGGLSSLTSLCFPRQPWDRMTLRCADGHAPQGLRFSAWPALLS